MGKAESRLIALERATVEALDAQFDAMISKYSPRLIAKLTDDERLVLGDFIRGKDDPDCLLPPCGDDRVDVVLNKIQSDPEVSGFLTEMRTLLLRAKKLDAIGLGKYAKPRVVRGPQ